MSLIHVPDAKLKISYYFFQTNTVAVTTSVFPNVNTFTHGPGNRLITLENILKNILITAVKY